MTATASVACEKIGKRFRLGEREPYRTLRESLAGFFRRPVAKRSSESIWALRDVTFTVQPGEVVGVIGRNGAGKTTLLKILSSITHPSEGRAVIAGRVACLLEVGTGFHPELTGRENIYFSAAILGMRRAEVAQKFDEIVAFAETERFLDTPVKRYSVGMFARLAFSVAAHLDSDVLLVDEVLAVGDAAFQRKCLSKMNEVGQRGRTVFFVSHNMSAVRKLCTRAIVLDGGRVITDGDTSEAIQRYMTTAGAAADNVERHFPIRGARPQFTFVRLRTGHIRSGDNLVLDVGVYSPLQGELGIGVEFHDERGIPFMHWSSSPMAGQPLELGEDGSATFSIELGPLVLATGTYHVYLWLAHPYTEIFDMINEPFPFFVDFSDPFGTGFQFMQSGGRGMVTVPAALTRTVGDGATVGASDDVVSGR